MGRGACQQRASLQIRTLSGRVPGNTAEADSKYYSCRRQWNIKTYNAGCLTDAWRDEI